MSHLMRLMLFNPKKRRILSMAKLGVVSYKETGTPSENLVKIIFKRVSELEKLSVSQGFCLTANNTGIKADNAFDRKSTYPSGSIYDTENTSQRLWLIMTFQDFSWLIMPDHFFPWSMLIS